MSPLILVGLASIALWSLVAHRFNRTGSVGPAVLTSMGALTATLMPFPVMRTIDTSTAQHIVEFILALLLFVDACEVRGSVFGGHGRAVARLVLIALPLSIALAVVTGHWLLPDMNFLVLMVIACVVMPIDFAPVTALLRSRNVPERVRRLLNVESGYNDGLIAPIFGMSLALAVSLTTAVSEGGNEGALDAMVRDAELSAALESAVPASILAIVVGAVMGSVMGLLARWATRGDYASAAGVRAVMLLTPLLTFGIASLPQVTANGYIAAFVAGVCYRFARVQRTDDRSIAPHELALVEEAGGVAANIVWFVLGLAATVTISAGIDWRILPFVILALTVLRLVPVVLAFLGSPFSWSERVLVGLIGPRGTATIALALLAFNRLPDPDGKQVLDVMVIMVVSSVVLHGVLTPMILRYTSRIVLKQSPPEAP